MTQWYYYEAIALLILSDNKNWAKIHHVNPEVKRSVKHCLVGSIFLYLSLLW